ncbi:MAG: hypothetical protein E6Q93_19625 [Burkholderiaceae bacterium]|jgi:polyhydroxyalkanoate synthesis regulator phasin|nr:MAG: hypothetical protein E6Q93_19625 [Burkholderiaceae bacterium]
MPSKKTPQRKTAKRTVTAVAAPKAKAVATAKTEDNALKQQLNAAVEGARETSRENMLARLGLIARMRKQREERMADLIEEGKRFEPKVKRAIEDLKAKLQPSEELKAKFQPSEELKAKFDLSKFKLEGKSFDREAIKARLQERMTGALHRMGLATHKEVDVLAKKVNKLAAMQHA